MTESTETGARMVHYRDPTEPLSQFEDVEGPHPKLWAAMRRAWTRAQHHRTGDGDRHRAPDPHTDSQVVLVARERCAYADGYLAGMVHACAEATGTPAQRFYELLDEAT